MTRGHFGSTLKVNSDIKAPIMTPIPRRLNSSIVGIFFIDALYFLDRTK